MKKNFLFAAVAFAMISVSFTSCKKNECIECNGVIDICEDEYKDNPLSTFTPWSTYKTSKTSLGCTVVDGE